jgi:TetR/AcrR family transcriptional regulator, transcriptional repressor for nem operon
VYRGGALRVVVEAAKAIRADGPDRIAVAGLMAKAGLTHGGFYAHFSSKDALVAEAISQMFMEGAENFQNRTLGLSPRAGLIAYFNWYLSPQHCDGIATGCPLPSLLSDAPRLDPVSRAAFVSGIKELAELIAAKLRELNVPEPEKMAFSMLADVVGAVSLARAMLDAPRSKEILTRACTHLSERIAEACCE